MAAALPAGAGFVVVAGRDVVVVAGSEEGSVGLSVVVVCAVVPAFVVVVVVAAESVLLCADGGRGIGCACRRSGFPGNRGYGFLRDTADHGQEKKQSKKQRPSSAPMRNNHVQRSFPKSSLFIIPYSLSAVKRKSLLKAAA